MWSKRTGKKRQSLQKKVALHALTTLQVGVKSNYFGAFRPYSRKTLGKLLETYIEYRKPHETPTSRKQHHRTKRHLLHLTKPSSLINLLRFSFGSFKLQVIHKCSAIVRGGPVVHQKPTKHTENKGFCQSHSKHLRYPGSVFSARYPKYPIDWLPNNGQKSHQNELGTYKRNLLDLSLRQK